MPLAPGTRLGPYHVTAKIGEGGMGEVYRARDSTLDRDVALKVLPEAFTTDPDRLARFEREARVLASLNHANIGHIYGLEEADGVKALVLELIDGPTLADHIARRSIPIEEALRLAGQIAEALDAAHGQGIIHRDLKPANVKVKDDGTVKVLDFGLAKGIDGSSSPNNTSEVSTVAGMATRSGIIVGTPAYMSPEQARGQKVDARTDIWAFGCLLYEMISGIQAFGGGSTTDTLVRVIDREPDWSALPAGTPPWLRRLLRLCLAKNPHDRLRDIGDVRVEMGAGPAIEEASAGDPVATVRRSRGLLVLSGALLLLAGTAVGVGVGRIGLKSATDVSPVAHLQVVLPPDQTFPPLAQRTIALSPDGRQLAYVTLRPERRIYLRRLNTLEATPVAGTEEATSPFFSPDGTWLGFWKDRQLHKVSLAGGAPIALCPARTLFGASWSEDDRILFGQANFGIFEVSAEGGEPKLLIAPDPDRGEIAIDGPQLLPDGRSVLFSLLGAGENWDRASIVLQRLDTGERHVLVEGGTDPRLLPSGHLLFVRDKALYALPFDGDAQTVSGSPVPVVENLTRAFFFETGAGQFSVSTNGTLAYIPASPGFRTTLVWVDRTGHEEPLPLPEGSYIHARLSPDGQRIAVDTVVEQDVWIYELARGTMTRLTSAQTSLHPVWTADGSAVIFDANLGLALERKPVDGSQPAEIVVTDSRRRLTAVSVSPDGRLIAVEQSDDYHAYDIGVASLGGDGTVQPLLADPEFRETSPVFSPDGRWLLYVSDETGQDEVYVQSYPELDQRWLVSNGGGVEPMWSPTGTEIFYRTGPAANTMMAVPVRTGSRFELGQPERLFATAPGLYVAEPISAHRTYDLSTDGERFLMAKYFGPPATGNPSINVVVNWFDELTERVPAP